MEGKALLFKEFGGIDAWPICLDTKDPDEIVAAVEAIAPGLRRDQPRGHRRAALLRDRAAPARVARHPGLPRRPARHRGRRARGVPERAARRRQAHRGRQGRRHRRRRRGRRGHRDAAGGRRAQRDRLRQRRDDLPRATGPFRGQGCASPRRRTPRTSAAAPTTRSRAPTSSSASRSRARVSVDGIRRMAPDAVVFAMANPTPEVSPEEIAGLAAVVATGRSDYPNQINNVLAFPGSSIGPRNRAREIPSAWRPPPAARPASVGARAGAAIVRACSRDVVVAWRPRSRAAGGRLAARPRPAGP